MKRLSKDPLNIIISGVGGQGNILASELLASAFVELGYYTTVGETYGASQRGGPVMSHVRISDSYQHGPLIPGSQADIIVGFEPIETLRVVREYANKETRVIINPRPNYPLGVLIGEAAYPGMETIIQELGMLCGTVNVVEATVLAQKLGNSQAANIILMGSLVALSEVPMTVDDYDRVLSQRFSGTVLDFNRAAFSAGLSAINEQ